MNGLSYVTMTWSAIAVSYLGGAIRLFLNQDGEFSEARPVSGLPLAGQEIRGLSWGAFDGDGDLDVSLTETFVEGAGHPLFRNRLPTADARRSLQVRVVDGAGRATQAGAEVRLYTAEDGLLGTRLVPTGDGYGSQGVVPVHFGLATEAPVSVEVAFLTREGRMTRRLEHVDPRDWHGKVLVVTPE